MATTRELAFSLSLFCVCVCVCLTLEPKGEGCWLPSSCLAGAWARGRPQEQFRLIWEGLGLSRRVHQACPKPGKPLGQLFLSCFPDALTNSLNFC